VKAALERNISGRRGHEDHVTTELYSVPFGAFDGCFVQLLEGVKICVAVMGEGGVGGGGEDFLLILFVPVLAV